MKNTNFYQTITDRILTALDQGIIPWRKPFKSNFSAIPVNYATGKSYRGINILLLNLTGWHMGYPSNAWLTFQQAKQLGGSVKKGERSETIVFWKPSQVTVEEPDNEEKTRQTIYIARSYSVFNIDQCQGLNLEEQPVPVPTIDSAEQVYANFPEKRPTLQTGNKAAYYPRLDQVRIPAMQDFECSSSYYATLFHELVHSTGHDTRLNRDGIAKANRSDEIQYAQEELVAELGASFLCGLTGIDSTALTTNTTAYIQNWLKALADDKQMVVKAASQAQAAVDYILGTVHS